MDQNLQKRISETEFDNYPLDRLLPLHSVWQIFADVYKKETDKNKLFNDRKFQKLREGYFSIFVAAAYEEIRKEQHYLIFPKDPGNDVYIAKVRDLKKVRPQFEASPFDIKEFTHHTINFADFVDRTIKSKLGIYNLIIATYQDLHTPDLNYLLNTVKHRGNNQSIWLTGSPAPDQNDARIGRVTLIQKEGVIYDEVLDLSKIIKKTDTIDIYQDVLRFKENPS